MYYTKSVSIYTLLILLLTACAQSPTSSFTPSPNTSPTAESQTNQSDKIQPPDLLGTRWQLLNIQSMDDNKYVPENSSDYQIGFEKDGTLTVVADCNRGRGQWDQQRSQLTISNIATTRAECGPNSLHNRFIKDLNYVRSFVFVNGHIFLATMADGAILEFIPSAPN